MDKVKTGVKYSDEEKELALGTLVGEIRNDIIKQKLITSTTLTAKDFHHLTVTPPSEATTDI